MTTTDYINDGRTFDQDRILHMQRSTRLAWTVAGAASCLAGGLGLAIGIMGPLKTVEPYVVKVENGTGIVEVVSALRGPQTYTEAITQANLRQYVTARESFVQSERQINFKSVVVMSAQVEQHRFAGWYGASNASSPQNVYGETAIARVAMRSMTFLSDKTAQVRFVRTVTRQGQSDEVRRWLATITFRYSNQSMPISV